jgi:DNA-binding winged helix-turn-helix (wHTH) protein
MSRSVAPSPARQIFRFGEFELDSDSSGLRRCGREVRLQPQPMKLLALLLRNPGAIVTREDIRAELWPEGTYVDFDQAVNFAIRQVRDALGDSAERPVYVQTLPRRGYRFIAPVEDAARAASAADGNHREPGTTTIRLQKALWSNIAELKIAERRQRRLTMIVVAAAVLMIAVLAALIFVFK